MNLARRLASMRRAASRLGRKPPSSDFTPDNVLRPGMTVCADISFMSARLQWGDVRFYII